MPWIGRHGEMVYRWGELYRGGNLSILLIDITSFYLPDCVYYRCIAILQNNANVIFVFHAGFSKMKRFKSEKFVMSSLKRLRNIP